MRGWLVVVLGLCGCAHESPIDEGVDRLVSGSPARIGSFMYDTLSLGGVWFPDPACQRFSTAGPVARGDRPKLAHCLASLHLARGKRRTSVPNMVTVVYPPGIELEAAFADQDNQTNLLGWLGYTGRESAQDALPTITQELMESHRRGSAGALDHALLDGELAARRVTSLFAWVKICIDAAGAVTSVRPRLTNSVAAQQVFVAAASAWTFEPVVLAGQPTPVCSMILAGYPRQPDLPLPFVIPPGVTDLPVVSLDALGPPRTGRIAWMPDWQNRYASTGALACVDETGAVDRVAIVRRSGVAEYDDLVRRTLRGWAFVPYVAGERPLRVCAALVLSRCWVDGATHACPPLH